MRISDWSSDVCSSDLVFRRQKIALDGPELFKQEYPTFPRDAFLTSGAPVFNLTKLSERREAAPEIKHRMDYDPIEQKMVPNPRGRLLLYREIDPTMEYTIGADVAKGTGGEQEGARSEEHTSELQSLMRISYAVFCLTKQNNKK